MLTSHGTGVCKVISRSEAPLSPVEEEGEIVGMIGPACKADRCDRALYLETSCFVSQLKRKQVMLFLNLFPRSYPQLLLKICRLNCLF